MKHLTIFVSAIFLLMLVACGGAAPATSDSPAESEAEPAEIQAEAEAAVAESESAELTPLKEAALETYADIVFASYEDSLTLAVDLQEAINVFVENPSEATHQVAKDAWLAAQEPYGQTEAYRFYGGPIDDEDGPEGLLNAWPLDENYVDYVQDNLETGIINNVEKYPEITKDLLVSLNEVGAEENISTGYHAIEFLLWGQDLYEDSAGQRAYTDYSEAPHAERRGQYLTAAAELLVEHLTDMTEAWDPSVEGNYREEFLAMDPDTGLQNILTGLGVLSKSELAGERMFTAYDNQDQEDEHSCFSDNTHRDIITNNQGIVNVYTGTYIRLDGSEVSGTGIAEVVEAVDPALNEEMLALLEQSVAEVDAIHVPFDQAIVLAEERPIVLEAVMTLQDQGDKVAEIGSALNLTINTALPE